MSVKPIPTGYHTISPYLLAPDADKLIRFLQKAFGATVTESTTDPQGAIAHAEVKIGTSIVMVGGKKAATRSNAMLYLYVEDTDATYRKALAAGGVSIMEPRDQFYGDRNAAVEDLYGHQWWLATRVENLSPGTLQKRAEEFYSQTA